MNDRWGNEKQNKNKVKMEQNSLSSIPLLPQGSVRALCSMLFIFLHTVGKNTRHGDGKEEAKKMKIGGKAEEVDKIGSLKEMIKESNLGAIARIPRRVLE